MIRSNNNQTNIHKYKKINDIIYYNDYEMNFMAYEQDLIYDKLTFIQINMSLLKSGHILLFLISND